MRRGILKKWREEREAERERESCAAVHPCSLASLPPPTLTVSPTSLVLSLSLSLAVSLFLSHITAVPPVVEPDTAGTELQLSES